jgi:putative sporulation protein YtxC
MMLLKGIVYDSNSEEIISGIDDIKHNLAVKGVNLGISEEMEQGNHFIKVFCSDVQFNKKILVNFNLYFSMLVYKILAREFYDKKLDEFICDTYFFLRDSEIDEVKKLCMNAFFYEGKIKDETDVFCINRRNLIVNKIKACINETEEINIEGYVRFRVKETEDDFESIVDKVIEKYMVEKEYDEFIKLLKYFVDIQECKIDEVNIYANKDGEYKISDSHGNSILNKMSEEVNISGYNSPVNKEDLIISGLITLAPKKIVIHCADYFFNKELLETIKKVFEKKTYFCDDCETCKCLKKNFVRS